MCQGKIGRRLIAASSWKASDEPSLLPPHYSRFVSCVGISDRRQFLRGFELGIRTAIEKVLICIVMTSVQALALVLPIGSVKRGVVQCCWTSLMGLRRSVVTPKVCHPYRTVVAHVLPTRHLRVHPEYQALLAFEE